MIAIEPPSLPYPVCLIPPKGASAIATNADVIRSIAEPTLLPAKAPKNIPIMEMIIVAVVKSKTD